VAGGRVVSKVSTKLLPGSYAHTNIVEGSLAIGRDSHFQGTSEHVLLTSVVRIGNDDVIASLIS